MFTRRSIFTLLAVATLTVNAQSAVVVKGDYGYQKWTAPSGSKGVVFDASQARFVVANSTQANPTNSKSCKSSGPLKVNLYPVNMRNSSDMTLLRALIDGEVPQNSDWGPSYCNSAAIFIKDNAYNTTIDGVRIDSAWDGIRAAGRNSGNFTYRNAWLSDVRDDCVENDHHHSGRIENSLFDGCFQGISMREDAKANFSNSQGSKTLVVEKLLMRMKPYSYQGKMVTGAFFKVSSNSPSLVINNSVLAIDAAKVFAGDSNFELIMGKNASKLKSCSNNKVLWMHDDKPPAVLGKLASCFKVVTGSAARAEWENARCDWINQHPASVTRRHSGDPASCNSSNTAVISPPSPPQKLQAL